MDHWLRLALAWCGTHPWIATLVIWPFGLAALNLFLARQDKEEEWIKAHPRAAAGLLFLDAAGYNPWKIARAIRAYLEARRPGPPVLPLVALAILLPPLTACASSWQAQRPIATAVAQIANGPVYGTLQTRYLDDGIAVTRPGMNKTPAEFDAAVLKVKKKWAPIWASWDTFAAAADAWDNCIGGNCSNIDQIAAQARSSYCRVRLVVIGVGVRLPDFPVVHCPGPPTPAAKFAPKGSEGGAP